MDDPAPQTPPDPEPSPEPPPAGPQAAPEPPPAPEPVETPEPAPEPSEPDPRLSELEAKAAEAEAKAARLSERLRANALDLAVSQVMAGHDWRPGPARRDAELVIRSNLEVVGEDDALEVRDKTTGKPAAQSIAERIEKRELVHFFMPKGYGTTPGGNRGTPAPEPPGPRPGSVEWHAERMRREQELQRRRRAGLPSYGWPGPA